MKGTMETSLMMLQVCWITSSDRNENVKPHQKTGFR
ncbi:unnamed protein product [Larinioides sclopetarius]|uniref:Ribosomal protein L33 n=1 Tax=Larinioides sclopetarius TaxID=280406 RepID=A0AAV1YW99_9ARAC